MERNFSSVNHNLEGGATSVSLPMKLLEEPREKYFGLAAEKARNSTEAAAVLLAAAAKGGAGMLFDAAFIDCISPDEDGPAIAASAERSACKIN